MAQPILIVIKKKTKVPTKHQLVHQFRSDWKHQAKYSYTSSKQIFKSVSEEGVFETDAQFCKFIKHNFGTGIYYVCAWKKGHKGIINFMMMELYDDYFKRIKKNKSQDEKNFENDRTDYKRIMNRLKNAQTEEEREEIKEDLKSAREIIETDENILDDVKKSKKGCGGYLKSIKPLYAPHPYEDYHDQDNKSNLIEPTRFI